MHPARQEQFIYQSFEKSADHSSLTKDKVQTQECNTQFMLKGASQPQMPRCRGSSKLTTIAMATLFIVIGVVVDEGQIISLGEGNRTQITNTSSISLRKIHISSESELMMPNLLKLMEA